MTVNDLAKVFEDCNFHIIDRESWNDKTLELFNKEVKHCYVNDSYAECVRVEVE